MGVKLESALFAGGLLLAVAAPVQGADIDRGKSLYEQFCARCHGENGYRTIPQAVDLARGHGLMRSNAQLKQRLEAGNGLCPSYRGLMESRDFTNLISYIRTLR